ncbi:selenide,water dikinase [Desulfosalsimonas propionicica]|uniref:Selenide, water dikinase n=1 Tax=Desulfosalsimonas propionicica TaxID=332175 RepID=A0A7W0C6J0_9BACT|nr:selenide,water dikinase [Desulfosalsimonas propionicica]
MQQLPVKTDPRLLVGMETSDDAGVYQLSHDTALIQTLDFFTPIIDSPYDFGRIAAANALSDIYAMGGRPLTAMNIVCFPSDDLPESVLKDTLAGGLEVIHESGAVLVGGHSVDDVEFKYGLSVTGVVHPDAVWKNSGAASGDQIILTKPIGTGILATAVKGKLADDKTISELIAITTRLNKNAALAAERFSPRACTDVTGFGLAGHLLEMARASKKEISLSVSAVPVIESALEFGRMGLFPAGAYANKKFFEPSIGFAPELDPILTDLLFDPQTSGGLLLALPESKGSKLVKILQEQGIEAGIIGEVTGPHTCGALRILP